MPENICKKIEIWNNFIKLIFNVYILQPNQQQWRECEENPCYVVSPLFNFHTHFQVQIM